MNSRGLLMALLVLVAAVLGERFLLLTNRTDPTRTDEASSLEITVVVNWVDELKARVPTQ